MPIIILAIIFCLTAIIIGRGKGLRAVISLALSVFIIAEIFIPLMIHGTPPVIAGLSAAVPIVVLIVYITEGFNRRSHLSLLAIALTALLVLPMTWLTMRASNLSGLNSEEVYYVANLINPFALAFTGIMIGTIAIVSEVVITQISTVEQLFEANSKLSNTQAYSQALAVGEAHLSAVINTLFLIYLSTALPLVLLVVERTFVLNTLFNSEPVMSEIIRTLAGAIAVVISIPISTALGIWLIPKNEKEEDAKNDAQQASR